MDVTHALLVAMMFVMVLSIGIGNILLGLSGAIDRKSAVQVDWLPLVWVFILLLTSLELFWQTLDILSVEEWTFGEFLLVISGPVILLFATSLMLPEASLSSGGDYRAHYFQVARRFFSLFAGLMLWMIVVDLVFRGGLGTAAIVNLLEGLVLVVLASTRSERAHTSLTVVSLAVLILETAVRGTLGIG